MPTEPAKDLAHPAAGGEPALSIRQLGKMYQLYGRPQDRLKQAFLWGRRKFFREFWALRDVSFDIHRGEVVGIIGRNGSGKSTLLQILAGVLKPTVGEATVRGRVAALLELGSGFNPEFTGRENIYMNATILGLNRRQIDQRLEQIATFSEIGAFIDQPVKTYSSGMVVRLAFSVAVHVDADILVVDEALSVGDTAFQFKCLHHLEQLLERGVTVLLVSHSMQLVKAYCTRCIYLRQGQVQCDGDCETAVEQYLVHLRAEQAGQAPAPGARVVERRRDASAGRIEQVRIGCGGEERAHFRSGERIWLEVRGKLDRAVRRLRLVMVVRDLRAYNLFVYSNVMSGHELEPDRDGRFAGRFSFDSRLQSGDYSITLRLEDYLTDAFNTLLDKQVNAAVFQVLPSSEPFGGVVDLDGAFAPLPSTPGQRDEQQAQPAAAAAARIT